MSLKLNFYPLNLIFLFQFEGCVSLLKKLFISGIQQRIRFLEL